MDKLKVDDLVRVRYLHSYEERLKYSGHCGVVTKVTKTSEQNFVMVDSDEYTKRTGKKQFVSFHVGFSEYELDCINQEESLSSGNFATA